MFQELEEKLSEICKKYPCVEKVIDEKGNVCIVKKPELSILTLGKISFFADNIIMIEGSPTLVCENKRIKLKEDVGLEGSYFIRDESFAKLLEGYVRLSQIELYFTNIDKEKKYEIGAELKDECCGIRFRFSGRELDDKLVKL